MEQVAGWVIGIFGTLIVLGIEIFLIAFIIWAVRDSWTGVFERGFKTAMEAAAKLVIVVVGACAVIAIFMLGIGLAWGPLMLNSR